MLQEEGSKFVQEYNVILYPDNNEINKYYYTRTQPRLHKSSDSNFSLTLIGLDPPISEDNAGMLSLVVDLSVPQDDLAQIQKSLSLSNQSVVLEPIPWLSGTSTLALISATKTFTASPSLINDNCALFSIPLSLNDFILLEAILQGKNEGKVSENPISIVYKLTYNAVRKALKCQVTMDWDRFEQWRQTKCQAKILFIDLTKTDIIEELKEQQIVKINCVIDSEQPQVELQLLRSLTFAFFEPLPVFKPDKEDNQNGWGIGFSCIHHEDTGIAKKSLNLNLDVESAVLRYQYFQGLIANLHQEFKNNKIRFIKILSNSPFTQTLTVSIYGDFQRDEISYISLRVFDDKGQQFGTQPYDFRDNRSQSINLTYPPQDNKIYYYQYEIYFSSEYRQSISSDKSQIERLQTDLTIIPRDYYTVQVVPISTGSDFPWNLMQNIIVSTKISEEETSNNIDIVLDSRTKETNWTMYVPQPNSFDFYYQVCYVTKGSMITTNWIKSANNIFLNSFTKRKISFSAKAVNWTKYRCVQVLLKNRPNILFEGQKVINFNKDNDQRQSTTYYYIDSQDRDIGYSAIYTPYNASSQKISGQITSKLTVNLPESPP